jgi:hypothetical protein
MPEHGAGRIFTTRGHARVAAAVRGPLALSCESSATGVGGDLKPLMSG